MYRIIIAPNSFRGNMSTFEVANAIEKGLQKAIHEADILKVPIADGGEYTVDVLLNRLGGKFVFAPVIDCLCRPVKAKYGILPDGKTAIIEMTEVTGIKLVSKELLNPMKTTSYGAGLLIKHAIHQGCSKLIIGLGGSAIADGGAGMLQALGVHLLNLKGEQIGFGGGALSKIDRIDTSKLDPIIKDTVIVAACDVNNVLVGFQGNAIKFARQKGANIKMIKMLDYNLSHFAKLISRDLKIDVSSIAYGGANGGLAAALFAFLNAKLECGINLILKYVGFEKMLSKCDFIITAEGKLDAQTLMGKAPYGIAKIAKRLEIPSIIIIGQLGKQKNLDDFSIFNAILPICCRPMTLNYATKNASELIAFTAEQAGRLLLL